MERAITGLRMPNIRIELTALRAAAHTER